MQLLGLALLPFLLKFGSAYKILVLPMNFGFSSRLRNMEKMADILVDDSHDVSIVVNNKIRKYMTSKKVNVIEYQVPEDIMLFENFTATAEFKLPPWFLYEFMADYILNTWQPFCQHLLFDKTAMEEIKKGEYDLIFGDMIELCSGILADHLKAPLMLYQNFGFPSDTALFYPALPGMNCIFQGIACLTDDMNFYEKFKNLYLIFRSTYSIMPKIINGYEDAAEKAGINLKQDLHRSLQGSILLLNTDFVFEYPRPVMPNVFPIIGIFQGRPKALPKDLLEFIEGSAPHGVILVSFGTQISVFSEERAELFTQVFSRLKQRVIWRYTGKVSRLSENVKLVGWFPQTDVLAHPLVKVFVSHCGISGVMESIHYAVPVLAMPLFADQYFNAAKLINRVKMGRQLEFFDTTEDEFLSALEDMVNNKAYKENALIASSITRNQPVPPKDKFLHLVNFSIQTKGAKHLLHQVGLNQTWYQMLALDVIVPVLIALTLMSIVMLYITFVIMRCVYRRVIEKNSKVKMN